MKNIAKLPLYLGISVLVISVLISAVAVGGKNSVTNQQSQATNSSAVLSLRFNSPDLITVFLNSSVSVAGADVKVKYNPNKVEILSSTLVGSNLFTTVGGFVDEGKGIFSFSALAKNSEVTSGMIANFTVANKGGQDEEVELSILDGGDDGSKVIENAANMDILSKVEGVKFRFSAP